MAGAAVVVVVGMPVGVAVAVGVAVGVALRMSVGMVGVQVPASGRRGAGGADASLTKQPQTVLIIFGEATPKLRDGRDKPCLVAGG